MHSDVISHRIILEIKLLQYYSKIIFFLSYKNTNLILRCANGDFLQILSIVNTYTRDPLTYVFIILLRILLQQRNRNILVLNCCDADVMLYDEMSYQLVRDPVCVICKMSSIEYDLVKTLNIVNSVLEFHFIKNNNTTNILYSR